MLCPICNASNNVQARYCKSCGTSLGALTLAKGTVLNGRYQLDKVLGQGGFGITYLADDQSLERKTAIKELFPSGATRYGTTVRPPATSQEPSFAELKKKFLDEARLLAKFKHDAIVRVLDLFEENGTAYIVMEHLEGESLQSRLGREGSLAPQLVIKYANDVLAGLSIVHGAGLLHRDLKPDNLIITPDDRIVMIDFGSARNFDNETMQHTRLVTPGYAPPEQYSTQARFGPYTDLYALGATLYHALTGAPPPASTDRLMGTALQPLPKQIPGALGNTVIQALELHIAQRFQSTAAMLAALEPSKAPSSKPLPSVPKPRNRTNDTGNLWGDLNDEETIILEKIVNIVADKLSITPDEVMRDAAFINDVSIDFVDLDDLIDDLGADSLDLVEVLMGLEDEFEIDISDEEITEVYTVGDVIRLINSHVNSHELTPPVPEQHKHSTDDSDKTILSVIGFFSLLFAAFLIWIIVADTRHSASIQTTSTSHSASTQTTPASHNASIQTTLAPLCGSSTEIISFADDHLARVIQRELNITRITCADMRDLEFLPASRQSIRSLYGLEQAINMTALDLSYNHISDLTPLKSLTSLTELSLRENEISDITHLGALSNLIGLSLDGNEISNIAPISNLTKITTLHLNRNQISNITPLVNNIGINQGDRVDLSNNHLDLHRHSPNFQDIEKLLNRGVEVLFR